VVNYGELKTILNKLTTTSTPTLPFEVGTLTNTLCKCWEIKLISRYAQKTREFWWAYRNSKLISRSKTKPSLLYKIRPALWLTILTGKLLHPVSREKKFHEAVSNFFTDQAVWGKRLDICLVISTSSRSITHKKLGQYPTVSTGQAWTRTHITCFYIFVLLFVFPSCYGSSIHF